MGYNIQNYWGSELCSSSGILKKRRNNNVTDIGYVFVDGRKTNTLLEPLDGANLNHWTNH
jgi:hypothetical protein